MKKFHAMLWIGVALVVAGVARLVAPFAMTIGTVRTSCGNPVAYLDGQDNSPSFVTTLSVCAKTLKVASLEGAGGLVVGVTLFIVGLVVVRRRRRRRRPSLRRAERRANQRAERRRAEGQSSQTAQFHEPAAQAPPMAAMSSAAVHGRDLSNPEVYEQFMRLGRLTRPKTVLSFFAAMFAALVAGSVIAISLFLKRPELSRYIPWILGFDAIVTIVLIIGVFVTITKDPARLMLSEITNQNAIALRRGRRRDDAPMNEGLSVQRIPGSEEHRDPAQFRRRWDDPN